ncbi:hypothetical protein KEM56_005958 [Ascosphaera pollenicola]|nr:hypothetical protein KEM56_005958 [Ascosphaera pollenicola]
MAPSTPRHISNPRRLLILAPDTDAHATIPPLLQRLTGSTVEITATTPATTTTTTTTTASETARDGQDTDSSLSHTDSLAGYVSHPPLCIRTKYYSADIPIWVDEVPLSSTMLSSEPSTPTTGDPLGKRMVKRRLSSSSLSDSDRESSSLSEWKNMFLGSDAQEVRDAVGAIVICVSRPKDGICSPSVPAELIPEDAQDRQRILEKAYKDAVKAIVEVKTRIEEERELTGGEVPGVLIVLERDEQTTKATVNKAGTASSGIANDDDDDHIAARSAVFSADWWDEELSQMGIFELEVAGWDGNVSSATSKDKEKGNRNQFGELMGIERAIQVLETHEWDSPAVAEPDNDDDSHGDSGDDEGKQTQRSSRRRSVIADLLGADSDEENDAQVAFDADMSGLDSEMAGLHMSLMGQDGSGHEKHADDGFGVGEDVHVEQFETLIQRVQALKDMNTADLPYEERKRLARKAVEDIMKTI